LPSGFLSADIPPFGQGLLRAGRLAWHVDWADVEEGLQKSPNALAHARTLLFLRAAISGRMTSDQPNVDMKSFYPIAVPRSAFDLLRDRSRGLL
jgi:hypothetical protein